MNIKQSICAGTARTLGGFQCLTGKAALKSPNFLSRPLLWLHYRSGFERFRFEDKLGLKRLSPAKCDKNSIRYLSQLKNETLLFESVMEKGIKTLEKDPVSKHIFNTLGERIVNCGTMLKHYSDAIYLLPPMLGAAGKKEQKTIDELFSKLSYYNLNFNRAEIELDGPNKGEILRYFWGFSPNELRTYCKYKNFPSNETEYSKLAINFKLVLLDLKLNNIIKERIFIRLFRAKNSFYETAESIIREDFFQSKELLAEPIKCLSASMPYQARMVLAMHNSVWNYAKTRSCAVVEFGNEIIDKTVDKDFISETLLTATKVIKNCNYIDVTTEWLNFYKNGKFPAKDAFPQISLPRIQ